MGSLIGERKGYLKMDNEISSLTMIVITLVILARIVYLRTKKVNTLYAEDVNDALTICIAILLGSVCIVCVPIFINMISNGD